MTIRPATGRPQIGHDPRDERLALGSVAGRGLVDRRPEQLGEDEARVGWIGRRPGQHEMDAEARPGAGRGGQPGSGSTSAGRP